MAPHALAETSVRKVPYGWQRGRAVHSQPRVPSAGALYFITGSCGAGKTTLLRQIVARVYPRLAARHIDDFGVPTAAELERAGGGWAWQTVQARKWAERALRDGGCLVVEGQARPSDVLAAAQSVGLHDVQIALIDCDHAERRRRLHDERRQPELDQIDVYAWAAYLRGQADALGLDVIDTTGVPLDASVDALAASIGAFARAHGFSLEMTETLHGETP